MIHIYKYPRTFHIAGSGIQRGDEDLALQPVSALVGRHLLIEEKMDGANCAVSFAGQGQLLLQSRGHYLSGGPREAQFALFKTWAFSHMQNLWEVLGERYIMYGEWLYAKHTIFYTALPHYFMEFDIYDKVSAQFLSTERRRVLLGDLPCVVSVKVLYAGQIQTQQQLIALIGHSYFISDDHLDLLRRMCNEKQLDVALALKETDSSTTMEGLYIKIEADGIVQERYKYVRTSFLQTVFDAESHWMDRPMLANRLRADVTLF